MFKKKKKTINVDNAVKHSPARPENPKRKKRRARHIFRLIILLSVCALGWATYDNLKQNVAKTNIKTSIFDISSAKEIPVNPIDIDTSNVKAKSILFNPQQIPEQTERKLKTETQPNTDVSIPQTIHTTLPKPEETIIPTETTTVIPSVLEEQIEVALSDTPTPVYSLKDALIFRDHFLSEKPCGDDFRKLILSDNKQSVVQEVIKATSYFCLTTNNVYGELDNVFKKAKQNALIKYYYAQDSEWLAKIKSVAIRIIQIRDLNPVSDDIPAILDRAQNTLIEKNIAQTVELIASLPDNLQPEFETFLEKAQNYADASAALENLILSYAKGE